MNALFLSTAVLLHLDFVLPAILPIINQTRKYVLVFEDGASNCDDKDYVFSFSNFSVARVRTFLLVNGTLTVQRDLIDPITIKFQIEKCGDKGNPDSCEYYITWKWDDICSAVNILPFTQGFQDALSPHLKPCPYKKNVYELRNFKVSSDTLINLLPDRDSRPLWKFHVTLRERNERLVSCIKCSFRFATRRQKP